MLFAHADEVHDNVVNMKVSGGELRTKQVFGVSSSLMVASRSAGYHSEPHFHDCEQLNYVQSGEIWVFIEFVAYHLQTGDFLRIPPSAVHWAWNRGDGPCELVEVHNPGLALPGIDNAPVLVDAGESVEITTVPSRWADKSWWEREEQALHARGVTL